MNTQQLRILIIENDVKIAQWLRRALEHPLGGRHEVEVLLALQPAYSKLQRAQFDLIALTLEVEDEGDLDTVKQIQALAPDAMLVLVTEHDIPALKSAVKALNVAHLIKPFELHDFVSLVQLLIKQKSASA